MRTIHFKNGDKKEITQEIAQHINNKMMNGCENFQCFSDEKDQVFLIINLLEVTYID